MVILDFLFNIIVENFVANQGCLLIFDVSCQAILLRWINMSESFGVFNVLFNDETWLLLRQEFCKTFEILSNEGILFRFQVFFDLLICHLLQVFELAE